MKRGARRTQRTEGAVANPTGRRHEASKRRARAERARIVAGLAGGARNERRMVDPRALGPRTPRQPGTAVEWRAVPGSGPVTARGPNLGTVPT